LYPVSVTVEQVEEDSGGGRAGISSDFLAEVLVDDAQAAYGRREAELGEDVTRELERKVILTVLDRKWREHLYEMDYLRDGIGLRAMAQRDPLVEYQREGFDLFTAMMDGIKEETVGYAFNVEVEVKPQVAPEVAEQIEVLSDASESEAGAAIAAAVSAGATQSQEAQESPTVEAAGLGPSRPDHMEYSAPDESGGIMHGEMNADEGGIVEVDLNASRAERRRAERSNRKNAPKKKKRR
jgi:preprotein translocase subunit SecA